MSDKPVPTPLAPSLRGGQENKLAIGIAPLLEPGETALAAIVAQPRGTTQAVAGSAALGSHQAGGHQAAAQSVGLVLARPMGVVLTDRRLITVRISTPIGLGIGGSVKGILSAVLLDHVAAIVSNHWKLGQSLEITVGETAFRLEMNARASGPALTRAFTQLTGR